MQIHDVQRKTKRKTSRQVGRGGTRGKTAGRGTKGQKARAGHKIRPEIRDMIKRIPKLRGRGANFLKSIKAKPVAVNLAALESAFKAGEKVTPSVLVERGVIRSSRSKVPEVKIVSDGELTKKVIVSGCKASKAARDKIEKAGGEVK